MATILNGINFQVLPILIKGIAISDVIVNTATSPRILGKHSSITGAGVTLDNGKIILGATATTFALVDTSNTSGYPASEPLYIKQATTNSLIGGFQVAETYTTINGVTLAVNTVITTHTGFYFGWDITKIELWFSLTYQVPGVIAPITSIREDFKIKLSDLIYI